MYNGSKSRIAFNGEFSEYFPCKTGVRQGENLSPLLFALYLNDLETFLLQHNVAGLHSITDELEYNLNIYLKLLVILYADDTVLLSETREDLQHQLNIFSGYCKEWKLQVNVAKTKVMVFSKGRLSNNLKFTFDGMASDIVKEFKYLGILG